MKFIKPMRTTLPLLFNPHRHPRILGLLAVAMIVGGMLSGCTKMMGRLGYIQVQTPVAQTCATSNTLITNLNINAHQRSYMLRDGRPCPEVNDYERNKHETITH